MEQPERVAKALEPCLRVPVGERVTLDLTEVRRVTAFGIAALGARLVWLIRTRRMPTGSAIRQPSSTPVSNSLARMGLYQLVQNASDRVFQSSDPSQRPQELWLMDRSEDIEIAVDRLARLLRGILPANEEIYDKIKGIMSSLCENSFRHARSLNGTVLCGQAFPKSGVLEFAVADTGCGITDSLNANPLLLQPFEDDETALRALLSARTRVPHQMSRPCTLATLAATAKKNRGEMRILSSEASLSVLPNEVKIVTHLEYPGTVVGMRLNIVTGQVETGGAKAAEAAPLPAEGGKEAKGRKETKDRKEAKPEKPEE